MTAAPRHVYLDLGTNWGDTLDLYRKGLADGAHANATNWRFTSGSAAAHAVRRPAGALEERRAGRGASRDVLPAGWLHQRPYTICEASRLLEDVGAEDKFLHGARVPLRFGSARARPRPAEPRRFGSGCTSARAPGCNGRRSSLHLCSCSGGWAHGHHLLLAQANLRRRQLSSHVRVSKREH